MKAAAIAALLAALCVSAAAEEPAPQPPAAEAERAGTAAEAAGPAPTAAGLLAGTLGTDIDTASFYELAAWCRGLGLAESGSRRELQERLRAHYGLTAPVESAASKRTVTVRSARSAEYFTIERADESYLVLSGDVVIELRDAEEGATHTIRAGRLTYNQTRRTLSASGGVQYTLEQKGRTETFEGRSLSLDIDTWEAQFFGGRSSKTQARGDRELTWHFEGASISRLSDDQILLEEGSFTSCDLADPHYAVRAKKVWILAPGEWALSSAVVTVGRVPVLWMPFFFYPGDRLVFNPSFGFRQREGAFVQTTTYLAGRRTEEESPFSFLKLTETDGGAYEQELRGIFLRKLPTRAPASPPNAPTLKLLVDAYSRLGVFLGFDGRFPPDASFMGGIAFSRSIFLDEDTGLYTPYFPDDPGTTSYWNRSVLLGIEVPFRFGFEGEAKATRNAWTGSLHFELFSDPDFSKDFYGRGEGFRLTETLTPAEGAAAASTTNLTWDVANRFDLTKAVSFPGVTTFTVPYLDGRFQWLSRQQPVASGTPEYSDPGRTFYYPASITAPRAAVTVAGDLLRIGGAAHAAAAPVANGAPRPAGPGKGFRDPFAVSLPPEPRQPPAVAAASQRFELRRPSPRPDAKPAGARPGPSLVMSYQLAPRAELTHTFDAEDWTEPSKIDMGILYGTFETAGTGRVQTSGTLLGNRLDLAMSLGFDSLWRLRFNPSASLLLSPEPPEVYTAWEKLLLSDLRQDRFDVTSTLGATLRPFDEYSMLAGTTIAWQLGMRLVQVRFKKESDPLDPLFETLTLSPENANMVSAHTLQATVPVRVPGATASFTLSAVVPPVDGALTARLDATAGFVKARLQAGGNREGGTWEAQPLVAGLSAEPWKGISLSEELQASLEGDGVERSTTTLAARGFTASFVAERLEPVNPLTGLPTGSPEAFLASTAKVAYEGTTGTLWSWKDRVKIEAGLNTSWFMNIQRFTDNLFDFKPRLTLSVHDALDLSFSSQSVNTKTYRYLPGLAEAIGDGGWVNPFYDLMRSFNFFDTDPPAANDRYLSAFKIRSISLKAVHHLHDWDLTVEYTGSPKLVNHPPDIDHADWWKQYEWSPTFSIQLQWLAVPELKAEARGDRDEEGNARIHVRQ